MTVFENVGECQRGHVLTEALQTINGARQDEYGQPENNFKCIADLWNTFLNGRPITARDVAIMLALMKVARISTGTDKKDSYIDAAGYIGLAADIAGGE